MMDIVDEKLIPLNGAIRKLTTDLKLRKRLHDNYKYHAKKNGLILKNNKTEYYQVDAKQFYDWVKQKFPLLKVNIPEEYRLTAFQGVFNSQNALHTYAPTSKFSTLDDAEQIIQDQADEIRDLKNTIEEHKKTLAEVKIKADKWDRWIKEKGYSRVK